MSVADFVNNHPFSNPLQRLILLKILMSGSLNGEGKRVLDHEVLASFCCCSRKVVLDEVFNLARAYCLKVRTFGHFINELEAHIESAHGYTIIPVDGEKNEQSSN